MSWFPYSSPFTGPFDPHHDEPQSRREHCTPVEHTDNYKIVVILDESGSMDTIREKMRLALNDLIKEQKQVKERPCNFTLVKFNHQIKRIIENKPLSKVNSLRIEDYAPNGNTALYDAIGETMDAFRHERDVLMVIITDGQENASKHYKKNKIMRMIKEKEQYAGWTYVYLSCDLETAAQGDEIGLNTSAACSNCIVRQDNYGEFMNNISSAIKKHRKGGMSVQSQLACQQR